MSLLRQRHTGTEVEDEALEVVQVQSQLPGLGGEPKAEVCQP